MNEQNVSINPEVAQVAEVVEGHSLNAGNLLQEQNFPLAVFAGVVAALVGAGIWAGVTIVTGYQIGYMAIGVGFLVAIAIRVAGKGLTSKFQILGALLALAGCLLGNFLTVYYFIGQNEGLGFFEVMSLINPAAIPEVMISTFSAMDLLFYGIAIFMKVIAYLCASCRKVKSMHCNTSSNLHL